MPETEGERARRIHDLLSTACPGGVTRHEDALEAVSTEASHVKRRPTHLATPRTEGDVASLVKAAVKAELRLTCRGAGTSMAGQSVGKGLMLDFSRRMRRVQDPDAKAATITGQPGAVLDSVLQRLAETPWTVWPDPSSRDKCTLGGMVGNNASGIHGLGYGATIENVASLRAVLADGRVVDTADPKLRETEPFAAVERLALDKIDVLRKAAPKVAKNASGYRLLEAMAGGRLDPTRLIVGSEGTLAVVTEVRWRLHPRPSKVGLLLSGFATAREACAALPDLLALRPAALELVDEMALEILRAHRKEALAGVPEGTKALLLTEFHGFEGDEVWGACEQAHAVCKERHALAQSLAKTPEERDALWNARRGMEPLLQEAEPGKVAIGTMEDPCVPVEKVADLVEGLQAIYRKKQWKGAVYGHAGQGNLHARPLVDPASQEDRVKLREAEEEYYALVARLGGSISGEHGDGSMRAKRAEESWGEAFPVFEELKRLLDPTGRLNPGVKIPR